MNEERFYPVYLFFLGAVLFFTALGTRDFWAPVEPRYGEIARVMFAKGDWILPTVNGDLYTDKPILYFWLVLIAAKLAGVVNEWTVRLPAAIGGVGFILATYFFARDFFSPRIGLLAAAMLATCVRVIWEARWAHIDILFGFLFLLSVYYAARAFLGKGHRNDILLAYLFIGLATLAKGLIGVVLPALLLISFMIVRRDWRMIGVAQLHLGIPIFLLVVTPWFYLVSAATDGKWLSDFIYIQHIQRYTAGVGHRQPFYYYLTTLPVDCLPWTTFAIPALLAYRPFRGLRTDRVKLFFALWFLTVFLFFSASDTKRELYLIPLFPVVAVFLAHYFDDLASGRLPQSMAYGWIARFFFALISLEGLALPMAAWILRRDVFWISLPVAGALAGGGGSAIFFVKQREPLKVVVATTLMMVFTLLCVALWIFPYVERFKSYRPFALEINRIVPVTAKIYIYADTMNDFNYYTGREVMPVVHSPAEVKEILAAGSGAYLLVKDSDLESLDVITPERIVKKQTSRDTVWNLIALSASPAHP
jgi:4-amino-4-deoxy-L-arabinose transferase-like glycosyltransferase